MGSIKVDAEHLFSLGAVCQQEAGALSTGRPEPPAGPIFQATTGAVSDVSAMASRAENLISVRLRTTGHAVVKAATRLVMSDDGSRDRMEAVGAEATAI
ncbi:hypothetical protein CQY20_30015 [Mycolicibacterium agri]|nr:hypothetical protein CQY20_30015 [Mycolicibacterium agri]